MEESHVLNNHDVNPMLPELFLEKMAKLLDPKGFQQLLASYQGDQKRYKGIRANTLKCGLDQVRSIVPYETEKVPWCPTGVYIDADIRPGKHPAYYGGLYYVQEPTAMIPAEVLSPEPGDIVLDLCAAPGGKTTQLACKLQGKGLLAANELVVSRAGVLAQNVERMGIPNTVIFNAFPEHLAEAFPEAFDKVLVDAPCSGEGMFRKEPAALQGWSPETVARCAARQLKILESVDKLLKPGGILVYSTCTFSPEEDEQIVEALLETGRYVTEKITLPGITESGRPEWTKHQTEAVTDTLRVMPYNVKGEGHYIARLRKIIGEREKIGPRKRPKEVPLKRAGKKALKDFYAFADRYLNHVDFIDPKGGNLALFGEKLYALPEGITPEKLAGLRVVRPGLHLGDLLKQRFEPSHTLAMALQAHEFSAVYNVSGVDEANTYLKGEPLTAAFDKGWVLVCYEGYPLGFGKSDGRIIKNHYPKGLRIRKK